MGAIISYFGGNTGRTDDPDPVTGLTSRERYLLRTSWEPLKKDLVGTGCTLLHKFFTKYPEELQRFPFKDVPLDQLMGNKKYQAHCSSVVYSLSSIVDSINDADLLVNILVKLGISHNRRQIPMKSFDYLKEVTLDLFGSLMNKESVAAWTKALDVAFKVIGQELTL